MTFAGKYGMLLIDNNLLVINYKEVNRMGMSYDDRKNAESALTAARNSDDKALASQIKAQYIGKYASDSEAMRELKEIIYYKTDWSYDSL